MQFEFDFRQRQAKARVWLDALPDWPCPPSQVVEETVPAEGSRCDGPRRAAVEWLAHTGGHFPYGLLAAEFVPQESNRLLLQTLVSADEGPCFPASLAGVTDNVRFGLIAEYAGGVMDSALEAEAALRLGSGVLRFHHTAHGEVGSSTNWFRRLTGLVVQLLCLDASIVTAEQVARLFERPLTGALPVGMPRPAVQQPDCRNNR